MRRRRSRLTAKTALKGGGVLAGAGGGAALCAWGGPLAAVCGAIGGFGAWILADAAIVNLDGFFNGDEFEATLRELIDEHEADTRERIVQAFQSKAQNTDRVIAADFRLRDISNTARGR